jgi:hypothetical protein
MLLFCAISEATNAHEQSGCPAVNCRLFVLTASLMQQFGKFALGLAALLAVGIGVNARWGDSFKDPSPAEKQLREQFEAIETSANVQVDRHGCETLHKFVVGQTFFYQCPVSATQLESLRPALATRGWQADRLGTDAYVKGALRARLSCDAGATACTFRIETIPG